jgi:hypothetical protein
VRDATGKQSVVKVFAASFERSATFLFVHGVARRLVACRAALAFLDIANLIDQQRVRAGCSRSARARRIIAT